MLHYPTTQTLQRNACYLDDDLGGVARVRPDDEDRVSSSSLHHQVLELSAPHVLAGVPYVVAVADAGDETGGELGQHVVEGVHFSLSTPCSDRTTFKRLM